MKKEDVVKQLIPGVIVGIVLGSIIGYLAGVDAQNSLKNHIGGMIACLIPCLLNCTIVVKGTAKVLKRELSVPRAFIHSLPYIIIGAVFGLFFHAVILGALCKLDTREFSRIGMTALNMVLGVVVSTVMGFVALKSYEKDVKYTRREK